MAGIINSLVKSLWGNNNVDILVGSVVGLSGVRSRDERFGTTFVEKDARIFNDFIALGGLHDFALGGRRFTRFNREDSDIWKRDKDLMDMQLLQQIERESLKQKSRVKWAIEGDETPIFSRFILVNGSLTNEFKMERGVRQGDPQSLFLFLFVSKALQVMVIEACNKGIFNGVSLADNGANISLLQYVDDMTTLVEHIIVAGAENRPPMLEKSMYNSWESRPHLFIKGKKNGRMMLSIDNGPLVYPTVEKNGQTQPKKYSKLIEAQQLQDDCDVQAKNTILHDLPADVYALVNHQEAAKDIWDRVKLLMKGTKLSYQERECRLYNLFDKMAMQQVQVNTKFLNALPPECSKFVTDVKLAKSLYTTNYDQLYAYLSFHLQTINSERLPIPEIRQPFKMEESQFNKFKEDKLRVLLTLETEELLQPQGETMNSAWFKEKLMLAEAQEASQIIDEDQLAFIADPGIAEVQVSQQTIPRNSAFQTEDLDTYDLNCDDISSAKAVLMANLSSCDSDVLSESHTPIRIDAPSELPTISLVNESLRKLKYQLASFDKVMKKRTTSDAITADEITEVQTFFNQMEAAVDQCSVHKNTFEIQIKKLSIDNDQLLKQIMSQEIMHIAVNSVDIIKVNKLCVDECNKCLELETGLLKMKDLIEKDSQEKDTVIRKFKDRIKSLSGKDSVENVKKDIDEIETINIELEHNLNAQLQEKVFAIAALKNKLRKLKGKNVVDTAVSKPSATIAPGMFKLDIEPISHRLKNNRDAHEVYLEKTIENTNIIRGLVERTRKQYPSEPLLESACMFTKHIQKLTKKLGVNTTTSASGSKRSGNTKKNRISRPPSSNQKNKVEEHPRKVKSSLNKMNSVSKPISNAHVKHSVRFAKFESICAICNKCLFDANHDMCVIDYVNDVNVRRAFTIVKNNFPLTRITSTNKVPLKETTITQVITQSPALKVYSRKSKALRSVGSSSKAKIVESKTSNTKEPKQFWGSTISDVPSSSIINSRLSKLFCGIWTPDAPSI
ncbi:hypothetical protein Tco_0168505 [Tanacetum coccineum]